MVRGSYDLDLEELWEDCGMGKGRWGGGDCE